MLRIPTLLALAVLAAHPATMAAPVRQDVAIDASDLDLTHEKGRRLLELRIARAARAMCRAEAVSTLPHNVRRERKCIRDARAGAEAAVTAAIAASDGAGEVSGPFARSGCFVASAGQNSCP